jgi:quercetin dioxygenase-like cupin family protein
MPQPVSALPSGFNRSGFLLLIKEVNQAHTNSIEGVVRPGALKFTQQCLDGDYTHQTVSGRGTIDIEGTPHAAPAGTTVVVPTGKRFTYINDSDKDWAFKATHPFWRSTSFNYTYGGEHFAGSDVWFAVKRSPDSREREPIYRLIPITGGMYSTVVAVEPQATTFGVRAQDQSQVVTPIVGQGRLSLGLVQPGQVELDRSLRIGPGEVHRIVNNTAATALFSIHPDPPQVWTPASFQWEFTPGQFVSGDKVWFEFVFPETVH